MDQVSTLLALVILALMIGIVATTWVILEMAQANYRLDREGPPDKRSRAGNLNGGYQVTPALWGFPTRRCAAS